MLAAVLFRKIQCARSTLIFSIIFLLIFCGIVIGLLSYPRWNYSLWISSSETFSISRTPSYVITISGHDQRVPRTVALFKKYANLDLRPYYGIHGNAVYNAQNQQRLTPGERGLRDTMQKLFTMIIQRNYTEVYVFEDDAIPHVNFTTLFKQLPSRCSQADVLLLGASMWHQRQDQWPSGACFDADNRTYGAFALLIKRTAFSPIVAWLKTGEQVPYDVMYRHLQRQGLIVRVAYPPFLVIMDVSHPSLIDNHRGRIQFDFQKRAARHRWHLEDYPMSVIPV